MLADELDFVVGVDTHRDRHSLALVEVRSGGVTLETEISASAAGYRRALALAQRHAIGRCGWAVEGTGSYGAGLARFLQQKGERVVEVGRLPRERRSALKTDQLDAVRIARSVLGRQRAARPRSSGPRDALRALMVARQGALEAKKAALCQLRALIVTAPEPLRAQLAGLTRARLVNRCRRLRPGRHDDRGVRLALHTIAGRLELLTHEEQQLKQEIESLVATLAPPLLAERGVGPISAAQVLLAWSHHGRIHSEAAFARLAGSAPIDASSGQTIRHRLDRGGDRQLNRALHTIIVNRRKNDATTIAYIQRRRHEGKTSREATRCLKRYLARHLYRLLENGAPLTT
jgi:transposase